MTTSSTALVAIAGLALVVLLLAAVVTDVRSRRIPNVLVLTGLATAFTAHACALATGTASLSGQAWWSPAAGMMAGGIALVPLYVLRACGAGDVKLMAMAGAFLGAPSAFRAVFFTLLAGGGLSIVFMLRPGVAAQVWANIRFVFTDWLLRSPGQGISLAPLTTTAARLPYGVAISLGTLIALLTRSGS